MITDREEKQTDISRRKAWSAASTVAEWRQGKKDKRPLVTQKSLRSLGRANPADRREMTPEHRELCVKISLALKARRKMGGGQCDWKGCYCCIFFILRKTLGMLKSHWEGHFGTNRWKVQHLFPEEARGNGI